MSWRQTLLWVAMVVPLLGFARPDTLPQRRGQFEEVGPAVRMTVSVPELLPLDDHEAVNSIDSGFDTKFVFLISVWQHSRRKLIERTTITVKLRRDIWTNRYVLRTFAEGGWSKRFFETRETAIAAVIRLHRILIGSVNVFARKPEGPYYFVEILALRNPLKTGDVALPSEDPSWGGGRDLEWFGRLVEVLAGERAQAETVVHVRTNPFYLVSQ